MLVIEYNLATNEATDLKTLKPPRKGAQVVKGCSPTTPAALCDGDGDLVLEDDEILAGKYYLAQLPQPSKLETSIPWETLKSSASRFSWHLCQSPERHLSTLPPLFTCPLLQANKSPT